MKQCITCEYQGQVEMVFAVKRTDFTQMPELKTKLFCLVCMGIISEAYEKLRANNFGGIEIPDDFASRFRL